MCVFFRVLTPRCGDEPGTIERWMQGRYTGSHGHKPPHWIARWQQDQSKKLGDYSLLGADGCRYTQEALAAFLRLADQNQLSKEDLFHTGEYEGVAAFDNAEAALAYGGRVQGKLYVVFEGLKLAPIKEESDDGGWRAKVIREIARPMDMGSFRIWLSRRTA